MLEFAQKSVGGGAIAITRILATDFMADDGMLVPEDQDYIASINKKYGPTSLGRPADFQNSVKSECWVYSGPELLITDGHSCTPTSNSRQTSFLMITKSDDSWAFRLENSAAGRQIAKQELEYNDILIQQMKQPDHPLRTQLRMLTGPEL